MQKTIEKPAYSFIWLLIWFVVLLLFSPLLPGMFSYIFFNVVFSIILLTSIFTFKHEKWLTRSLICLLIPTVAMNSLNLYMDNFWLEFVSTFAALLFISLVVVITCRRVFFIENIKIDLIFGAICIYFLLGMMWALIYDIIEQFSPESFAGIHHFFEGNVILEKMGKRLQTFLYFSFVTQTTLGYGDITPVSIMARQFALIQAIVGQFYIATIIGGLLGLLLKERERR